jgi:hypothetical protein
MPVLAADEAAVGAEDMLNSENWCQDTPLLPFPAGERVAVRRVKFPG